VVSSFAFAPGGKLLAPASHDGTVKVWSLPLEAEALTIFVSTAYSILPWLAFSPDGRKLARAVGSDIVIYDFHAHDEQIARWLREAGVEADLTSQ